MDRDLVEQARRETERHSPSWCTRSATASTRSPSGSCATRVSPRTRCRTPLSSPGAASEASGSGPLRGVDPPDPRPCLLRRVAAGPSLESRCPVLPMGGQSTPDGSAAFADRDELERAFRRLTIEQRAVFVLHHYSGCPSWRSPSCWGSPRARPDRVCTTPSLASGVALTADRSPSSTEDVSHDRRSLARTRRPFVHRSRPDPGA